MQGFYVYILKCKDESFYVGRTNDIDKRISEHSVGQGCFYTAQRLPIELVFMQAVSSKQEAYVLEMQIKKWSRAKKQALIAGDWEQLTLLAKKKFS